MQCYQMKIVVFLLCILYSLFITPAYSSILKNVNDSYNIPTEEYWSESCTPPLPILWLAIWIPIVFPLIIWSLARGINYICREGEFMKKEISLWNKRFPFQNLYKKTKTLAYHGIILDKITMYLDNITIDFSKSVIGGSGKNIIGAYKNSGVFNEQGAKMTQTYSISRKDQEGEDDEHELQLEALLHPTIINNWNTPCFFGIYHFTGNRGIIALIPKEEGKYADETLFHNFFRGIHLYKPAKRIWALLVFTGITSTLSILLSISTNYNYRVLTNVYSSATSVPYDSYFNLTLLPAALFINIFQKHGVLQGFSFWEMLFKLSLLFGAALNLIFGSIYMIVAYWLYLDSQFSHKGIGNGSSCYEPLYQNIESQCFRSIYDCSVIHLGSGINCQNNFFCVSFDKYSALECSNVQRNLFLRIFLISLFSLTEFILLYFYLLWRKDSHRLRMKVLWDWIIKEKKSGSEESNVFSTRNLESPRD